jgi:hypothetical protein
MATYINSLNNESSAFTITPGSLTVTSLSAASTTAIITSSTTGVFSFVDTGALGTICVGSATVPKFLAAAGADNKILTSHNGADPSWEIPIAGGIAWTRETSASVTGVINHGYINTNVGLTTITLPATAALGTIIAVMGESAAGWKIAQNAGQSVQIGNVSTTIGITGYLASSDQYDVVYLVCRVVDTTWSVVQSMGNIVYS